MNKKQLTKSVQNKQSNHSNLNNEEMNCLTLLDKLKKNKNSPEFREPVDWEKIGLTSYPELIKKPMDLSTVKKNLKVKSYTSLSLFLEDIQLIWDNCKLFNLEESEIFKQACILEKFTEKNVKELFPMYINEQHSLKNHSELISFNSNKNVLSENNFNTNTQSLNTNTMSEAIMDINKVNTNTNTHAINAFQGYGNTTDTDDNVSFSTPDDKENALKSKRPKEVLSIIEKIDLAEKVRSLDNDSLTNLVNFLYQMQDNIIQDLNDEKLQIRLDLVDSNLFNKIKERIKGTQFIAQEEGINSNSNSITNANQDNNGNLEASDVKQSRVNKNKKQKN